MPSEFTREDYATRAEMDEILSCRQKRREAMGKVDLARAADFLEQYADFIRRDVASADIERHPYLPELEEVAATIRAAAVAEVTTAPLTNPAEESGHG